MDETGGFAQALKIEDFWMPHLEGFFYEKFGARYVLIGSATAGHLAIQQVCDVVAFDVTGTRLIEVKFDERLPEVNREHDLNLYAETFSNYSYRTQGWFHKSLATDLVYCFPFFQFAIVGPLSTIRSFVMKHRDKFREAGQERFNQLNDPRGLLVPVRMLLDAKCVRRHSLAKHLSAALIQEGLQRHRAQRPQVHRGAPTQYRAQTENGASIILSASSS